MSLVNKKQYFDLLPTKLKTFFQKYPPSITYSSKPTLTTEINANPFLPNKNPTTGRYHDPKYSLRRMSDLYKLAYRYGLQDLLPPSKKLFFEEKYEKKKMMRGVLLPKGTKHELRHESKVAKMQEAIKNADQYIAEVKGAKFLKKLEKRKLKERTWF
ncbi:HBR175Cp [Eremothecium sinecaudum]|uniref:HBR175Cp n=1 Tax=Eremothecium sinecaudum TaxID=45286 RepID=A0A109UWX9_9SACH|nr:HBR175Cp [Eremothecium sinecaudum]AMD19076.1 HBR175Cp [Eremothecium sinecaudum]